MYPAQPQRRPGGAPAAGNQFNHDANQPVGGSYRQPAFPNGNSPPSPLGNEFNLDGAGAQDDVFTADRSGAQNQSLDGFQNQGHAFNDRNNYPPFPDQQGYPFRGTPTTGPGGSPVNFTNPFPQPQTPYLGSRPSQFFDHGNQPFTPRGGTPFDDYTSSYSGSRSGSRPPAMSSHSYRGSQGSIDTPSRDEFSVLSAELRRLAGVVQQQQNVNEELKKTNEDLTKRLQTTETELAGIQEQLKESSKAKPAKDGSNKHPALKRVLHPLFATFCGIEWQELDKTERAQEFLAVEPLQDGQPFEEVEGVKIWHPNFKGTVVESVNKIFIETLVKKVWDDEMALRAKNIGEIPDDDFKESLIRSCAVTYFRNIHKSSKARGDPTKAAKLVQTNVKNRRRGRRSNLAMKRRKMAEQFEKETGLKGALAMIDTDFCSDNLTCDEDTLNPNLRERRNKLGFGKGTKMTVGLRWRSMDYVAFMRYLSFRVAGGQPSEAVPQTESEVTLAGSASTATQREKDGQPAKKKQRTKTSKKLVKTVWDAPPLTMYKKKPNSLKKPVAVKPFTSMVDPKWQAAHSDFEPLTPANPEDEPLWIVGFYEDVKQKKYLVMDEDAGYLEELCEWRATLVESGNEADEEGGDEGEGDNGDEDEDA